VPRRAAESLRYGRLCLAGIAAHIEPPRGVQSLNPAAGDFFYTWRGLLEHHPENSVAGFNTYPRQPEAGLEGRAFLLPDYRDPATSRRPAASTSDCDRSRKRSCARSLVQIVRRHWDARAASRLRRCE